MIKVLALNLVVILGFTFFYYMMLKSGVEHFNGLDKDSSLLDVAYFAFTVQSTVGFGDIYPKTSMAKMMVMTQQTLLIVGIVDLLVNTVKAPIANKSEL
jgi:voltage-gated potassium channel